MQIINHEFGPHGEIPVRHTCDGHNVSPALLFHEVPPEAVTLALIMDDPDAPGGTFVHWLVWNMPATTHQMAEGTRPVGVNGRNDFGDTAYGGPCPPRGTHRYSFRLYALDTTLDLPKGASKAQMEDAMEGHIMEQAVLVGQYSRHPRT